MSTLSINKDKLSAEAIAASTASSAEIKTNSMRDQLMDYWWLIALSISSSVIAQTIIKMGVTTPDGGGLADGGFFGLITTIIQSPLILGGLALYGVGALAWIMVLARLDLSYAYPFLALNFVLITMIGRFFLNEAVPTLRWFGLAFICMGIVLVARSSFNS